LTGKYRRDQALPESVRAAENAERRFSDKNWHIIETLVAVSEVNGHTPAQAAVNWMLAKPWVTAPIIGANTPAQLTDVLNGLEKELPSAAIAQLDDASEFLGGSHSSDDEVS
jgi:aryl-alcohol dehydrogenase-like predicted oxidoreductase